jgi:hypothetical protein
MRGARSPRPSWIRSASLGSSPLPHKRRGTWPRLTVSTTTLSLVARDELSDLVDFASALALAIAGYREREPDRGGVHGSGLEAQAMELTQRLTALLEQARGPPREPAAPERQGQKTLPSKSAEVKDRVGEDEPKPKRKQAAPAVVRPRATVSSRAARSRFRSRS